MLSLLVLNQIVKNIPINPMTNTGMIFGQIVSDDRFHQSSQALIAIKPKHAIMPIQMRNFIISCLPSLIYCLTIIIQSV